MNSLSNTKELGKLALRAARSVFLIDLLQKISGPLLTIILARFLTPNEFGLLGIATLVFTFFFIVQQGGISEAIIRHQAEDQRLHVGFWAALTINLFLYVLLWSFAPLASEIFSAPQSALVIRVLGLQLVISSLGTVPVAVLKRDFKFNKLLVNQFIASIVSVVVSILFASYGFGYWAVVYGMLGSNIMFVILAWLQTHYVPKFVMDISYFGSMLRFGGFVGLEALLGWFLVYFDNAVVGAALGTATLGIYSIAFNLSNTAIGLPVGSLAGVSLSTFSRLQNDLHAIQRLYLEGTKLIAAYCIPAGVGLSMLSEPIAQLLFNDNWSGIGVLIAVLALYAGFAHIWALNSHVFKALGHPDVMSKIYLPILTVLIPVFLISVNYGVVTFAIMRSVSVIVIGGILHTAFAVKMLNLNWNYVWITCRAPLYASFFLAACLMGLAQVPWNGFLLISLIIRIVIGLMAYLIGLYVFDKDFFVTLISTFNNNERTISQRKTNL